MWLSVDPLAEVQPNKTPYHFCSNNPINRTDPTGMIDGWIEHLDSDGNKAITYHQGIDTIDQATEAGYKGVTEVFQSGSITGTTTDGIDYFYKLNADATVTNSAGQTTSEGFVTPNGTRVRENPIGRYNMFFNGLKNTILGVAGTLGAIAAAPETGGASALALTLTTSATGIGFGQMLNAFQTNVDSDLQKFSTLPGLAAARSGSQYAPLIDGVSNWATGSVNSVNLMGNTQGLMKAGNGLLNGQNVLENTISIYGTYDAGKGLINGIEKPKK